MTDWLFEPGRAPRCTQAYCIPNGLGRQTEPAATLVRCPNAARISFRNDRQCLMCDLCYELELRVDANIAAYMVWI